MKWRGNQEYSQEIGDYQAPPDLTSGPSDMLGTQQSVDAMHATPLGEPPVNFDVRAIFDSRPVNAYDFNLSANTTISSTSASWVATFVVPNGYRMVPREWEVYYENAPAGSAVASQVTLQQNNADLPNNTGIIIGVATAAPIKSFFICEENTTFGIRGFNNNTFVVAGSAVVIVNVYGNLLPVTDVALPFEVTNKKYGG